MPEDSPDVAPGQRQKRPLSRGHFVPLVEALTWLALGDAMTLAELRAQVEGEPSRPNGTPEQRRGAFLVGVPIVAGSRLDADLSNLAELERAGLARIGSIDEFREGLRQEDGNPAYMAGSDRFADRDTGLAALERAWRALREAVDRGAIKIRGRHVDPYHRPDAFGVVPEHLSGEVLRAYSQFDVSTGGIRRRLHVDEPEVIWSGHCRSEDREIDALIGEQFASDGFLYVEVERDGLAKRLIGKQLDRAPSVKAGRPPEDDKILEKADEMKERGLTGREIASRMRLEAGFENVGTQEVRTLIKARWRPVGRRKKGQ